jgi:hypothetical protein
MLLLDRSEVRTIPLNVYFQFKILFSSEFFKMASIRVRLRPEFLKKEDFLQKSFCSGSIRVCSAGNKMRKTTADQHPRGALCVFRIPPEQKTGFLRFSAYLLNIARAKTRQVALRKIPLSAEI